MADIDFTQWTDAQLDAAAGVPATPAQRAAIDAELRRRKDAGLDDGSRERVATFMRTARTARRTRRPRRG